jgi:hypothetical protein
MYEAAGELETTPRVALQQGAQQTAGPIMTDSDNKSATGTSTAIAAILAVVFVPVLLIHIYAMAHM